MIIAICILAGLLMTGLAIILLTRTILSISIQNTHLKISIAIAGCGLSYESENNRISLFLYSWNWGLKSDKHPARRRKPEKKKIPEDKEPKRKSRRLPFSVIVKIVRASLLCVGRILSRVQYDERRLDVQPVIANPALAGMAYGWGQALGGMFPGLRQVATFSPSYGTGSGRISGKAVFSIKNRQIVYVVWRLVRDLPIKELVKYRFSKKR